MRDVLDRLRHASRHWVNWELLNAAADEIETLRATCERKNQLISRLAPGQYPECEP